MATDKEIEAAAAVLDPGAFARVANWDNLTEEMRASANRWKLEAQTVAIARATHILTAAEQVRAKPSRRAIARALFVHEYGKSELFDKWIEHGGDTDEAHAMLTKSLARADAVMAVTVD